MSSGKDILLSVSPSVCEIQCPRAAYAAKKMRGSPRPSLVQIVDMGFFEVKNYQNMGVYNWGGVN